MVRSVGSTSGAASGLLKAGRAVRWYWRGITGADAYERYAEHLRREHPDRPVPSEKEFWKAKYADQERNPTTRCC
ncbi:YbdD/YjiX family protein [Arsenicicoccus piscis]|uniref:YbdD/YjiX family protein n=1 Tax=Arsenicicoccus piscis TaxID=673954 RepID=A0ABQ6HKX9_9MICO|nr:YbdD/YjiX family protein [Arsenicicoccus piscis]MCH8627289.1 YbdD/YjiX family protein [Arsenicicoccus piscis]GMA18723.1 hypothetical protein GCM10025862_07440 [Arsenicicoccus piscis]